AEAVFPSLVVARAWPKAEVVFPSLVVARAWPKAEVVFPSWVVALAWRMAGEEYPSQGVAPALLRVPVGSRTPVVVPVLPKVQAWYAAGSGGAECPAPARGRSHPLDEQYQIATGSVSGRLLRSEESVALLPLALGPLRWFFADGLDYGKGVRHSRGICRLIAC